MLINGKVKFNLCYQGCSCHNTKQARRNVKKSAKRRESRDIRKEVW